MMRMATKKPGALVFYLGIAILVTALAASLVFGAFVGGPVVVAGLALIARGLTATGRKAAGQTCPQCSRKIVFEHEAEICEECSIPVHAACAGAHRATAHKRTDAHPFR